MVVAPSFTYYACRESARSPCPIKLSIVNDKKKKNNIVKDLRDFVDLNLCALVKKEGVDTVLRNATIITQKKIDELDRTVKETRELMELAIKRGEEREKELQMELLRREKRDTLIICFLAFMLLYVIIYK